MTYLRHRYTAAGLPDPSSVGLHTDGEEWVDEQVRTEFSELFPGSAVSVNPEGAETFALHVRVHRDASGKIRDRLVWGRHYRKTASLAIGFYCLDPRQLDVMPTDRLEHWAWRQRLEAAVVRARSRFPRLWAGFVFLYRRCASLS